MGMSEYFFKALSHIIIALPIVLLTRFFIVKKLMPKKSIKTTYFHEIGIVILILFIISIFSVTVIPEIILEMDNTLGFYNGGLGTYNIIPFKSTIDMYNEAVNIGYYGYFVRNLIGNVLIFMPIGLIVPVLWEKMNFRKVVLIYGVLLSLIIEALQLPQGRGTDVDDIMLNTLGVMLGYFLFLVARKIMPKFVESFRTNILYYNQ